MPSEDHLLTSPQAAAILGCSTRTVHRMIDAGQLTPLMQMSGPSGPFIFKAEDIALIALARIEAAEDAAGHGPDQTEVVA